MYGLIYAVGEIIRRDIIKKSFCFAFYSSATASRVSTVRHSVNGGTQGERSEVSGAGARQWRGGGRAQAEAPESPARGTCGVSMTSQ